MGEQPALQLSLLGAGSQCQEIERIGILKNLFGQIGIFRRKCTGEIRNGLACRSCSRAEI